jgi:hypothetical protein
LKHFGGSREQKELDAPKKHVHSNGMAKRSGRAAAPIIFLKTNLLEMNKD